MYVCINVPIPVSTCLHTQIHIYQIYMYVYAHMCACMFCIHTCILCEWGTIL